MSDLESRQKNTQREETRRPDTEKRLSKDPAELASQEELPFEIPRD